MPSPFPGMNPYLEQPGVSRDFHQTLIPTMRAMVVPQVRPTYIAKVAVDFYDGELGEIDQKESHSYIEILDRESRELITVIEPLSPTNKYAGPDRDQYLAKRRQILTAGANLVEIDLLRGGPRMPLDELPACDYCALVFRREELPQVGIWAVGLRERLPEIPIPLRTSEADACLDLQQALHTAYDRAIYGAYIYNNHPQPQLASADREWAEEILQGVRA